MNIESVGLSTQNGIEQLRFIILNAKAKLSSTGTTPFYKAPEKDSGTARFNCLAGMEKKNQH
ncbi:hypothetical protein GJU39_18635 [Pedobacter petrophilus]|uniref:Uncharacterized protein n=1 Tax=Pedobacter petrophilus TaxID=1908241 RepID=A0A7K0G3T3_9SPHI|nr:hypothetical protein [Pedobacter petrophilus]MRX78100.1 hypothetical protein [Pedobacter petrophilus]